PAQRLEVGHRLSERLALLRVRNRLLQRAAQEADAERADGDSPLVEDTQRIDEAVIDLADAVLVRHHDVLEDQLGGVARAHSQLSVQRSLGESIHAPLEDEGGNALL